MHQNTPYLGVLLCLDWNGGICNGGISHSVVKTLKESIYIIQTVPIILQYINIDFSYWFNEPYRKQFFL